MLCGGGDGGQNTPLYPLTLQRSITLSLTNNTSGHYDIRTRLSLKFSDFFLLYSLTARAHVIIIIFIFVKYHYKNTTNLWLLVCVLVCIHMSPFLVVRISSYYLSDSSLFQHKVDVFHRLNSKKTVLLNFCLSMIFSYFLNGPEIDLNLHADSDGRRR